MQYRIGDETFTVGINTTADDLNDVSLTPEEGETTRLGCRLTAITGNAFLLEVDGKRHRVHAVQGSAGWYVNLGGQQFLVEPPEILERERRRGAQVDAEKHVSPPMPGQVIKILVTAGEQVEADQAVIVISAMKMETSLTAPHAGEVTAINTQVGAQVMPGDILIDIAETEES